MNKKILIVGTSQDVIAKPRGEFIMSYFDDIMICNKSIFHLGQYEKYFGRPTIWGTCGWCDNDPVFDPDHSSKSTIFNILTDNDNITKVWCNSATPRDELDFAIPHNIKYSNIVEPLSGASYHSLGLQAIVYSMARYGEVVYMGIDSYRKSHHYYTENMPSDVMSQIHGQTNYLYESKMIKQLKQTNQIIHIDEKFQQ